LYRRMLNRSPDRTEQSRVGEYIIESQEHKTRLDAWADVMWALFNTEEFQFVH